MTTSHSDDLASGLLTATLCVGVLSMFAVVFV